jgi:hypothetical protein
MKVVRHLLLWLFAFFGIGEGPVGAAELLLASERTTLVVSERAAAPALRSDAWPAAQQIGAPSEPKIPLFPNESEGSGVPGQSGGNWSISRKPARGVARPVPGDPLADVAGFQPRAPPLAA